MSTFGSFSALLCRQYAHSIFIGSMPGILPADICFLSMLGRWKFLNCDEISNDFLLFFHEQAIVFVIGTNDKAYISILKGCLGSLGKDFVKLMMFCSIRIHKNNKNARISLIAEVVQDESSNHCNHVASSKEQTTSI